MENVAILMSTYNGEKYLSQQIDSILMQEKVDIKLFIRDDGSTDKTKDILLYYSHEHKDKIDLVDININKNIGITKSFFLLLRYVFVNYPKINYFCFSDQDDIWFKSKVARGVSVIKKQNKQRPTLYFSKKRIVDAQLNYLKEDVIRWRGDFWDFFDRSNASGCTMMMNRDLIEILEQNDLEFIEGCLHDAFVLRASICINAKIIYDDTNTLLYRQHEDNVVGMLDSSKMRYFKKGIKKLISAREHYLKNITGIILRDYEKQIPQEYLSILNCVLKYDKNIKAKLKLFTQYLKSNRPVKDKTIFMIELFGNII